MGIPFGTAAVAMALLVGCGGSTSERVAEPAPANDPATAPQPDAQSAASCPVSTGDGGVAKFQEAEELHKKPTSGPRSFPPAMKLYKEAAKMGHLEAQYRAGNMLFSNLFQARDPEPEERSQYVDALVDIFSAGLRGLPAAANAFPETKQILADKKIPAELEVPLSDVPREWLETAWAEAMRCWGTAN